MTTEKKKRSNYTEDFKREVVALVTEQGHKISEAARSLGVGGNMIGRWLFALSSSFLFRLTMS